MEDKHLHVEPIGLVFATVFASVIIVQAFGMFAHRLATLGHIVSATKLKILPRNLFRSRKIVDINTDKFIEKHGIVILKNIIRNIQVLRIFQLKNF